MSVVQSVVESVVEFQVLSWYCDDGQTYPAIKPENSTNPSSIVGDYQCIIHIFGRTADGKTVCLNVSGFKPAIVLHLLGATKESDYIDVVQVLERKLGVMDKNNGEPTWVSMSEQMCNGNDDGEDDTVIGTNMYGFTNMTQLTARKMRFKSIWAYSKTLNLLRRMIRAIERRDVMAVFGKPKLWDEITKLCPKKQLPELKYKEALSNTSDPDMFERIVKLFNRNRNTLELAKSMFERHATLFNVLDPLLQFLHHLNLKPAGWLKAKITKGSTPQPRRTRCDLEYDVATINITPVDRHDICSEILEMSFDIEVDSHDERFPDPEDIRNCVFQIGITLKRYGNKHLRKILLHYGCPCDPVPDTEVIVFKTEAQLLLGFRDLIVREQPDICWGWNIDNFDNNYLHTRAGLLGVKGYGLYSPLLGYECVVEKESFSSSAAGDNEYLRVTVPGLLSIDALIYCKRDTTNPMDSYKLDNVAKKLLNDQKKDVPPKEIFRHYKSRDPKRVAIVGEYCIQDTVLVQRIADKQQIINAMFAMANLCCVQVVDLVTRGQQIKMFSLLYGYCKTRGFLIPWFTGFDDRIYPKGALVLDPRVGYYKDPVTTLDFAALYPSCMRAYRLCYATCVMDPQYDNIPGIVYEEIDCELERREKREVMDNRGKMVFREVSTPFIKKVKFAQNVPNILPAMQVEFATARAALKKAKGVAKKNGDDFLYGVLHAQEIAVKVSSNSLYGFTGAHMLKMLEITGSVTAKGRWLIELTKAFMEKDLPKILVSKGFATTPPKLEVIGGDSVTGDTPVLVMNSVSGRVRWIPVKDFAKFDGCEWTQYNEKDATAPVHWDHVWSDNGWTRIVRLIRHKTSKSIHRVKTCCGIVDVTSDHSLIRGNMQEVRPLDVKVGEDLLHCPTLGTSGAISGGTTTWTQQMAFKAGKMYANNTTRTLAFCRDHGSDGYGNVFVHTVPEEMLLAPVVTMAMFALGFFCGETLDIVVAERNVTNLHWVKTTLLGEASVLLGKTAVSELDYLLERIGLQLDISTATNDFDANNAWFVEIRNMCTGSSHTIESIDLCPQTHDYVYDFETANHHFHVGPGRMVVHNTDSVFCLFPGFDVKSAIRCGMIAADILSEKVIARDPIKLEFEKTQKPFIIHGKKKYLARKFVSLDDEHGTVYAQGLATKRRNYCNVVKVIYEDLITTLMLDLDNGPANCIGQLERHLHRLATTPITSTNEEIIAEDVEDEIDEGTGGHEGHEGQLLDPPVKPAVEEAIKEQFDFKAPLTFKDFTISASLRAEASYKGNITRPHVALARRLRDRDPASAPIPGDRFGFVVIMDGKRDNALSENTEDPTFAQDNNLPIDRTYYLVKQVRNPIHQFMTTIGQKERSEALFKKYEMILKPDQFQTRNNIRDIRSYFSAKK